MQEQAAVTYVMPVLNEADHLEEAVRAILDQRYGGASELVLALGPAPTIRTPSRTVWPPRTPASGS